MTEEQVFLAALDLPNAGHRSAYLDTVCGTDTELRRQVEELLAAHFKSGDFLNEPVGQQLAAGSATPTIVETLYIPGGSEKEAMPSEQKPAEEPDDLHFLLPATRPDSLGRIGHYEVLQVLGKGGFGIVFRAFDDVLQRVVALKVLAPAIAATSPARKRFLREAQASARVRHENVVQVHAVEELPTPYLVMEFIGGETLQQRLDRKGPLQTAEIVSLGRQIAEGLAAAHATGLIHRDIKPGNVLIEGGVNERVKITDFGLARAADDASMTQSGVVAGTPMFMAPEQAQGDTLDQRADLFSLGSVLYVMASGRPPFRAATTFAVLKRVVEEAPRPITDVIPETPQWLCDIIAKLHAKKPEDRYQSSREVVEVLANCEAQLKTHGDLQDLSRIPQQQPAQSTPDSSWKWALAAVLLLPILALMATESTGITHWFPRRTTPVVTAIVPQMPDAEGWVQLFNGRDLTGWKTRPEAPGHWEVRDGVLVGSRRRSFLFTDRDDYANFHLRVEAKINLGGDSGVLFRTGQDMQQAGYEVEIHKNLTYGRKTGTVESTQADGPPLVLGLSADDSLTRPSEWFTLELIAQGNRFITKVNGNETAHCVDSGNPQLRGHIGLQVWNANTVVEFRKVEIKELPSSAAPPHDLAKRRFGSDEWIDVIPLIDPALDRWNVPQNTGKNAWRIEQGELVVDSDALGSKLLLPLDSDWPAFECEVELTRRTGTGGINVNLPTFQGDCPVVISTPGVYLGRKGGGVVLNNELGLVTGQRTTLRFDVQREQNQDHVSVWVNDAVAGTWLGDRTSLSTVANEGYPHARRVSLWVHAGGNQFVLHRIKVRMLDGGRADTLRPVPNPQSPPSALTPGSLPPTHKNSLGMEFVIVPKGKSWLGGGKDKLGDNEVTIPADFYLGKYEVTQEEWEKLMGENPSHFSRTGDGKDAVKDIPDADLKRFPVEKVSWDQCQVFVAKLNKLAKEPGWAYRLPTESEWEYACRGGQMTDKLESANDFCFASPTSTLLPKQANFEHDDSLKRTCKVGSNGANRLGLFDMHGNVWEWCSDTGKAVGGGEGKVFRGGGWNSVTRFCQATAQLAYPQDGQGHSLGLRLARVPSGAPSPAAKTPSADPDREAAEYVLSIGGKVRVDGNDREIRARGELPLETFRLTHVNLLGNKQVTNAGLAVFKDCKNLTDLNLCSASVSNDGMHHLKDSTNLIQLNLGDTRVDESGLALLKGCTNLTGLYLSENKQMTDTGLRHVESWKKLRELHLAGTEVTDEGMLHLLDCQSLMFLAVDGTAVTAAAREKLKEALPRCRIFFSGGEIKPSVVSFTDADVQRIVALPAAEQVEEVRKELMRRNPGFDGKVEHKIEGGVVREFKVVTDKVTDIAPIRVFDGLRLLQCGGTRTDKPNGLLADLTPLEGMNLAELTYLNLEYTKVADVGMVYFKDCKNLTALELNWTGVSDAGLAHFKGMPLRFLMINFTDVTDLTPLQGMPLENIRLTPKNITRGLDILRAMKSVKTIGIAYGQDWPAAEFWERYDKGEFNQ